MTIRCDDKPGVLTEIVEKLCHLKSRDLVSHRSHHQVPMPSVEALVQVMSLLRQVFFPGFFGESELKPEALRYYTGSALDRVQRLLSEQIKRGYCFACAYETAQECFECELRATDLTNRFLQRLPDVADLLASDVQAAYDGDPAAVAPAETIYCYPSITAMTYHRVAHELYQLGIPLIPRIISERSHAQTGIDVHPGARIGPRFFMDHGTGIVIGETAVIGTNVRLYQGVTLGAKSFPLDEQGHPIKGVARHPIVEDDVIIYAGATILGRITIGRGAIVGGNVWLTQDVAPGSRVQQRRPREEQFSGGAGI